MYLGDGLTFVISGLFVMYTKSSYAYLQVLGGLTVLCCAYLMMTFPESPKFLYSKGRYDELKVSFETIKKWNRVKDEDANVDQLVQDLKDAKHGQANRQSSFFKDLKILYNSREHRRSLTAVVGLWIYAAFNYYLIGYYVKYFPGDVFVNFMTMTVAEVLAPITLRLVQGRWPIQMVYRNLQYGCAISAFLYILNQHYGWVSIVPALILLIRIFVKSLYSLGYYANGKLFPTLVKTSIFSLTNGVGRPFSALSTIVNEYTSHPGEIFLATSLLFSLLSPLFPSSDNTEQELDKIQEKSEAENKLNKTHST